MEDAKQELTKKIGQRYEAEGKQPGLAYTLPSSFVKIVTIRAARPAAPA